MKDKILDIAFAISWEKGFSKLALSELLEKAAVSKGGFYHHFKSKEELGLELINKRISPWLEKYWIQPLKVSKNPLKALNHSIEHFQKDFAKHYPILGSPLSILGTSACLDPRVATGISALYSEWFDEIALRLEGGVRRRYINKGLDTRNYAISLVSQIEGALAIGRSTQDWKLVSLAFSAIKERLEQLSPRSKR